MANDASSSGFICFSESFFQCLLDCTVVMCSCYYALFCSDILTKGYAVELEAISVLFLISVYWIFLVKMCLLVKMCSGDNVF